MGTTTSTMEAYNNSTTGNIIKAGVNIGLATASVNPFVGLAIRTLDVTGVSGKIYQGVGNTIDNN